MIRDHSPHIEVSAVNKTVSGAKKRLFTNAKHLKRR